MGRFSESYYDVDKLAEDWGADIYVQLQNSLKKKKVFFTGELLESLKVTVHKNPGNWPTITISFGKYGKFIEMKNLYYSKLPPIEIFKEVVEKRGLSKFKYIPGYQNSNKTPTREQAISRIAWGMATARRYGSMGNQYGKSSQRKIWKQKTLGTAIAHLKYLVAETVANSATKSITEAFQNK